MANGAPNPFTKEAVTGALSRADSLSRNVGDSLPAELPEWNETLDRLYEDRCPRTYLGVLATTLVARMLSPTVNVAKIKKGQDPEAYAAPSIAKMVIPFAKNQGINLRSTSSQVMNGQPFMSKSEITADMTTTPAFSVFYEAVQHVQASTPSEAERVLALLFQRGRQVGAKAGGLALDLAGDEWAFADAVLPALGEFVDRHSEGGKSGQALAAAVLDTLYGADVVRMKKINDPSFSSPGDVTVGEPAWLSCEAKQVPVTTGTLEAFGDDCLHAGIRRALYMALDNWRYPANIDSAKLNKQFGHRMQFDVLTASVDVLNLVRAYSPGTPADQMRALASALLSRLGEIGCSNQTMEEYVAMLVGLGFTHVDGVEPERL